MAGLGLTARVGEEPAQLACAPGTRLNIFPGYSVDFPETLGLFVSSPSDVEMTGCTLVGFDDGGEAVSTYALTETLFGFQDNTYTNDPSFGDNPLPLPNNSFPDGTGAFAIVRGTAAVGASVLDVLADTDFVLGGVYDAAGADEFSNQTESDPAVREAAFVAAVRARLSLPNLPPVPQGIADGDVIEVETGGAAVTLAFSFLSPESGQTTAITLEEGDTLPDDFGFEDDGDFPGPFTFSTTPGNPATAEATFQFGGGSAADESGDYVFVVEACDDGPDGGECTRLAFVVRVNSAPTVACEPGVNLRMEFLAEDYVSLYISQNSPIDPSGCSLVTFDGRTERVVASAPLDVAPPYNDFVYAEDGFSTAPGGGDATLPAGAIPDQFGAVAVVRGAPAVGDGVSSVFGNVVSAVVYRTPDDVVGVVPSSPLSPPGARRAGGVADFAALLSALDGETEARPLAVGPNPTRGGAAVTFALDAEADVRLAVYDVLGREVAVLAEGTYPAGPHRMALDAGALPAGAYVVRLVAGGVAETARVTVVR